jgi:hypothetical protein
MMLLLNSTDLRNDNNLIYQVKGEDDSQRWYVVKDLGATFGATGVYRPVRNNVEAFEHEPFLTTDEEGRSKFAYRGLHKELLRVVSAADVRWTCTLLGRLSAAQWRDAFRAGGYSDDLSARYIAALENRLRAAGALDDTFTGDGSDYWANRRIRQATDAVKTVPKRLKR